MKRKLAPYQVSLSAVKNVLVAKSGIAKRKKVIAKRGKIRIRFDNTIRIKKKINRMSWIFIVQAFQKLQFFETD